MQVSNPPAAIANPEIKICDDQTALIVADGHPIFMIPAHLAGKNLIAAHAFVTTVSSSGLPTFQIRNITQGVDMLSTPITINVGEHTSYTATDAPVVGTATSKVAQGDLVAIDCDVAGTGTMGAGVVLTFQ